MPVISLGIWDLLQSLGLRVYLGLCFADFLETRFEGRQHQLLFFLAKLTEDLFEMGLEMLELRQGALLGLARFLPSLLFELLNGSLHLLAGFFEVFAAGSLFLCFIPGGRL